jgi:glycosyltransferase involved in cell wall biosynthesis
VIPLFNEEEIVTQNLEILADFFDRLVGTHRWCFILVENGSTDKTPELVKNAVERWLPSRAISLSIPNVGKAFKAGLQEAKTKWVYQIEIEQWDLPFMAWAWKRRDSYDLLLGSKRADPTLNHQEPYRKLLSCGLNAILQLFFNFTGTDTHGPKLLNRQTLREIIDSCNLDRGQFDSELVLRTARSGLRIIEAPTLYRDVRPHRNWMLSKIVWNCGALVRLYRVMKGVPYTGNIIHDRVSRDAVLQASEDTSFANKELDVA